MLASDCIELRSPRDHAAREPVASFGPDEHWDAQSAEALTRLYETGEGRLFQPHAGERGARPQEASSAASEAGAGDRTWLEARLCELGARLQDSLARLNPEQPLNTLSGRLAALEQRFGTALGRVAQRSDLESLRAIEAHVLELAAQLEASRERLAQIGAVEDQVRRLARRLDEGDGQRLGTLGKLLRDYIAEWRESEQRTASALHNLEEAIARLGDSVDAMEASRPAPDLSLPALAGPEPERAHMPSNPFSLTHDEGAPKSYHARLEATDYAPQPIADLQLPERELAPPAAAGKGLQTLPAAAIEWSARPAGAGHSWPADAPPPGFRITAVRAKLRRTQASSAETASAHEDSPMTAGDDRPRLVARRTRFSLLLIAGVAFLAGGVYLLFQAIAAVAPPAASPVTIKPSAQSPGVKPIWRAPPVERTEGQQS